MKATSFSRETRLRPVFLSRCSARSGLFGSVKTAVALFFVVFGLITLKEGGAALLGAHAGTASGSYWPPVIALNTFTGLLYPGTALALFFRHPMAVRLSWIILGVAAGSALLFFGYILQGGAFETRTVYAILFRLTVAVIAVALVRKVKAANV